jgi:hypothetical protein
VDSKFTILFFKDEPNFNTLINCSVIDRFKNLSDSLASKDGKNIAASISKLKLSLNIAYGAETGFSDLGMNSDPETMSKLGKSLLLVREEFSKFSNLNSNQIVAQIPKIEASAKYAESSLKDYC